MRIAFLLGLVLFFGGRRTTHAQLLRGTVRDSITHTPVAGVAVLFADSTGALLARTLSGPEGDFRVRRLDGVRQVRVQKIGYRPAARRVSGDQAALDVTIERLPSLLTELGVRESPRCRRRDDRVAALSLWEQTRSALLATVIAREANPAFARRLQFDQLLSSDGNRIARQTVVADSAPTNRAFGAARTAADFVTSGFADERGGERQYYGPDAEILLDEAFASEYCFHIADAGPSRPSQVGVGFVPAERVKGRVDIEGTAWVDSATRQISEIEYRYSGFKDDRSGVKPGGRSTFADLGNGSVALVRWFIHMASPVQQGLFSTIAVRDVGGELAHLQWPDGRTWSAPLGTVRGRVTRNGAAVSNLPVQLIGTDYSAKTDANGVYEISGLVPGPYEIAVVDSALAQFGLMLTSHRTFVAARLGTETVDFDTPSLIASAAFPAVSFVPLHLNDIVGTGCTAADLDDQFGVIVARVALPDGSPAQHARWVMNGDTMGETDEDGFLRACRAIAGDEVRLTVTHARAAPRTVTFRATKMITAVTIVLSTGQ